MKKKPLLALIGPTAIGKTDISLELAKMLDGEIISADSMLIYREMNIGTAKPDFYQQNLVPHHMIDIVDPDQTFNAAMYKELAEDAIKDTDSRGSLPILSGGTGLYVNAVINGYSFTE
ncbi:MAG: tRNA (adenosine(37)-N6)-dimethylallyltransferase MiaA, partial [Peptococcaceae bacterium]|nr:tRNA (adenosine(37)-N6)-dimethylallyltransferase MiaA [Peptococcaceae bacterium]